MSKMQKARLGAGQCSKLIQEEIHSEEGEVKREKEGTQRKASGGLPCT